MNKLLVITGPTATGKTDVAIQLAEQLNGEIISCDSRQLYTGLDIGSGKMPSGDFLVEKHTDYWIVGGVKIWMYDVTDPKTRYTAADYVKKTRDIIETIIDRKKLPIICGGTGLYLKVLLEGLSVGGIGEDKQLRQELEALTLEELQTKIKQDFPQKWDRLNESDQKNSRRLIRIIEIAQKKEGEASVEIIPGIKTDYDILMIGLTASKELLQQKITNRLQKRFLEGLIDEAQTLHKKGLRFNRMIELGLEYKFLALFLKGQIKTEAELQAILVTKIYQYAKRQLTWFKKQPDIQWFSIDKPNSITSVENVVLDWYNAISEK